VLLCLTTIVILLFLHVFFVLCMCRAKSNAPHHCSFLLPSFLPSFPPSFLPSFLPYFIFSFLFFFIISRSAAALPTDPMTLYSHLESMVQKCGPVRPVHERYIWPEHSTRLTGNFAGRSMNLSRVLKDISYYCTDKDVCVSGQRVTDVPSKRTGVLAIGASSGGGKTHLLDTVARGAVDYQELHNILSRTHVLAVSFNSTSPLRLTPTADVHGELVMRAVLSHFAEDPVGTFSDFEPLWNASVKDASLFRFLNAIAEAYKDQAPQALLFIDEARQFDQTSIATSTSKDILSRVFVDIDRANMWCGAIVTSLDYSTVKYGVEASSSQRPVAWTSLPLLPTCVEEESKEASGVAQLLSLLSNSSFAPQLLTISGGHPRTVEHIVHLLRTAQYNHATSWEVEMNNVCEYVAAKLHTQDAVVDRCGAAIVHGLLKRPLLVHELVPMADCKLERLIGEQVVVNTIPTDPSNTALVPVPSPVAMVSWAKKVGRHGNQSRFAKLAELVHNLILQSSRLGPRALEYVHAYWYCAYMEARLLLQSATDQVKPTMKLSDLYDGMTLQCGPDAAVCMPSKCKFERVEGNDLLSHLYKAPRSAPQDLSNVFDAVQSDDQHFVYLMTGDQPGFDCAMIGRTAAGEAHVTLAECKYSDPASTTTHDASDIMSKIRNSNQKLIKPLIDDNHVKPENFAYLFVTLGKTTQMRSRSLVQIESDFKGTVFTSNREQTRKLYGPLVDQLLAAGITLGAHERIHGKFVSQSKPA
jgi:hypothetical protein